MTKRIVLALVVLAVVGSTAMAQQPEVYRHEKTGIEFRAPEGWRYVRTTALLDGGDQVEWFVPTLDAHVFGWVLAERHDAAEIEQRLATAVERKIAQRQSALYRNYDIRSETVRRTVVSGQAALTATATFETGSKQKQLVVESVAWVYSPNASMFLFAPTRVDKAPQLGAQFERFLAALRVPQ